MVWVKLLLSFSIIWDSDNVDNLGSFGGFFLGTGFSTDFGEGISFIAGGVGGWGTFVAGGLEYEGVSCGGLGGDELGGLLLLFITELLLSGGSIFGTGPLGFS